MPSADPTSTPPRPSIFISYASEDRAAARRLRETLTEAGLEVWYDEEELTGGDAWDQKIRRQIRDCEYFMPVISATTDRRKEGYFRREWRLACERSLDMADDVLFIVPVVIDDTTEATARVPDKFLTVQWLRTPGGSATPALHHLVRRLLAGEHHVAPRAVMTRAPWQATQAPFPPPLTAEPPPLTPPPSAEQTTPPPMPPFPAVPEKGGFFHGVKFVAEVLWWALTAGWMLFTRAPRWARILITVWLIITLFSFPRCSTGNGNRNNERPVAGTPKPPKETTINADTEQAFKAAIERFAQSAREARKNGDNAELSNLGSEIARAFNPGGPDGMFAGKQLVMVPFSRSSANEPPEKFASAVFAALYGRLTLTHSREVGLLRQSARAKGETSAINRAKSSGAKLVLLGELTGDATARTLVVKLAAADDGGTKWSESYPVTAEPSEVADQIATNVLAAMPHREPPPRPDIPRPEPPTPPGK
jgi:hypothetical protein